jgi:hypothetical protein
MSSSPGTDSRPWMSSSVSNSMLCRAVSAQSHERTGPTQDAERSIEDVAGYVAVHARCTRSSPQVPFRTLASRVSG